MVAIRPISTAARLDAALELFELLCPGAMARGGRDRTHYCRLFGDRTLFTAEDRDAIVGIFLGTPSMAVGHVYYDAMVAPGVDTEPVIADLVATASRAAADAGYLRMFSHEPVDGALLYEGLGHTPTMRLQFNGPDRTGRRARLQSELLGQYRVLDRGDADEWVDATFRIDRVDFALREELGQHAYAMHMMHTWTSEVRPSYVATSYRRYRRQALGDLRAIDPELADAGELHDDARQLRAGRPGHDVIAALDAQPATFPHGVTPASIEVQLTGERADLDRIVTAARRLPLSGDSFAVECRKGRRTVSGRHETTSYTTRDVEIRVGTELGHPVDLEQPDAIVAIYLDCDRALLGLSRNRIRPTQPTIISRAEHKLTEALDVFGIAATGRALDLGASPGGWSYVLAERGMHVIAVDPGDLDPRVTARVTHVRARAESLELAPASLDLIVNDMNLDPAESAAVMRSVLPALKPDGAAIMTIKLPQRRPEPGIAQAIDALTGAYEVVAIRHLPHNRQEVTALLHRATVRG